MYMEHVCLEAILRVVDMVCTVDIGPTTLLDLPKEKNEKKKH